MIYLYTGTPGSGKSLKATREILWYLEHGRNVIANYPVATPKKAVKRGGRFYYWDYSQMTPKAFLEFAAAHHKRIRGREDKAQTLVVIDESQIMFNSREFRNDDRMAWISFFSKHRHVFYDIILIAQNDRMLDRQIRSLAEYEVNHRNATSFGTIGLFIKLLRIRMFTAVHYYYGVKQKVGVNFFFLSRRDKRAYDSYLNFDESSSEPDSVDAAVNGTDMNDLVPTEASGQARGARGAPRLAAWLRRLWAFMNRPLTSPRNESVSAPADVNDEEFFIATFTPVKPQEEAAPEASEVLRKVWSALNRPVHLPKRKQCISEGAAAPGDLEEN